MTEYTPTTENVRFAMAGLRMSADRFVTRESFDRWLEEHDRQVAEKAHDEGFKEGNSMVEGTDPEEGLESLPEVGVMSVTDVETYWAQELGETVEIVPVGWTNCPTEFALYVGGTHVVAYKKLEEVEDYLSRYFVLKGA